MDMGQSLRSWRLAKERSNVLHGPCLSKTRYIPTQPLWFIHLSFTFFLTNTQIQSTYFRGWGGRQAAERGMLLPTSLSRRSLTNRATCCVDVTSIAHHKYFACQTAGTSSHACSQCCVPSRSQGVSTNGDVGPNQKASFYSGHSAFRCFAWSLPLTANHTFKRHWV